MRSGAILLLVACVAAAGPTGSIRGRVLGADGKGVPSVTVTARGLVDTVGRSATTDKDGSFLIDGLQPGPYELDVTRIKLWKPQPGEKVTMADIQRRAEVLPVVGGQHQRVMVEAGQRVERDFRIARTLALTLAVTQDGKPLADTPTWLELLDKDGYPVAFAQRSDPKRTDARGEIEFAGTTEGSYGIFVIVGEWEVACGTFEAAGKEPMRVPVALGTRRARLKVVDAGGKPVLSARPAMNADGGHRVAPKARTLESATGVYEIACLRDGRYTPTALVDGVFAKGEGIDIAAGAADAEITLRLPPAGSLLVRVTDRRGKPLEGCTVAVDVSDDGPMLACKTDAKGEVRVRYMPVGKCTVDVLDPPLQQTVEIRASAEAKVTLHP